MNDLTLLDLIPEYALGALSDEERVAVEGLLERSAEARARLAEFESVLAGLTFLTTPLQTAPANSTSAFDLRLKAYSNANQSLPDGNAVVPPPTVPPNIRRLPRLAAAIGFAAAVAALFLVAFAFTSRPDLGPIVTTNVANNDIEAVLADPSVQRVPVVFTDGSNATGLLYTNPTHNHAVLEISRLTALNSGQDYQVWLIDGNGPRSAGVFDVDTAARVTRVLVKAQTPLSTYQIVAVSVEPNGGSGQPTTQPIAAAKLQ